MGDAAFLILAMEPSTGLLIFVLGIFVGTVSGYIVDIFHGNNFMLANSNIELEFQKLKKTFVSKFNIFWLILFFPGFIIGVLLAFQIDVDNYFQLPSNISIVVLLGSAGAILSIFMWSLNPLSDFQCSTDKSLSLIHI